MDSFETSSINDEDEDYTDIDSDEELKKKVQLKKNRDSDVLYRRKTVRPIINSDSEDDHTDEPTDKPSMPRRIKPIIESESESDNNEESQNSKIIDSNVSESENELSISTDKTELPTKRIESLGKSSKSVVEASFAAEASNSESDELHSLYESSNEDVANLSRKMGRLSRDFQLEQKGVFNSTTIAPQSSKSSNIRESKTKNIQPNSDIFNTPNFQKRRITPDSSDVEVLPSEEEDIIEVSTSEDESPMKTPFRTTAASTGTAVLRQQKLQEFLSAKKPITSNPSTSSIPPVSLPAKKPIVLNPPASSKPMVQPQTLFNSQEPKTISVTRSQYEAKKANVQKVGQTVLQLAQMMRTINMAALPDGGKSVVDRHKAFEKQYKIESEQLNRMVVTVEDQQEKPKNPATVAWEDIQAGAGAVLPRTFGDKAMSTYNAQKALTMDRLQQLHSSLQTCPKYSDKEADPPGLRVELMPHQRRALAWLKWREAQKPSGGILADDMGLGKTLTMISLILKMMDAEKEPVHDDDDDNEDAENQPERKNYKHKGGTLIICPASLLEQWSGEIERRLKRGRMSYELFHGQKRESKPKRLAEHNVVITTYAVANVERNKNGVLYKIKWRRIILDEAHQIRNHRAQTSTAVFDLAARSRWALTGTPVHNKELDMYSLLKFLRCTPFDDLQVWKRWVGDKSVGGTERLHTVISSLMLRRTKAELIEKGALAAMPERKWELITVTLQPDELSVYQKVLIFSRTLFAQFLHQRAEKNQDVANLVPNSKPSEEYSKMRTKLLKLNKVRDVSQHEILVLILRLRQICNHPSLIKSMLKDEEDQAVDDEDEKSDHLDLLDQINKLNINDNDDEYDPTNEASSNPAEGASHEAVSLKSASKTLLNPSNPVFNDNFKSSKIKTILKVLKEKVLSTKDDKAVVVSQWPTYLKLIGKNLKDERIKYDLLDGSVPVHKRMTMVDAFNDQKSDLRILLLSLTAGGVGLNLIGGNHLILLDLHWNPQLENQAQDRIYRMGQKKPVFVYKFMAADTIEVHIKNIQDRKKNIAEGMLNGTKQVAQSKLSIQDLKMLFDM